MQWTIGRKLWAKFLVTLVTLIAVSWVAFWNMDRLTKTAAAVAHTQEVLRTLEEVVSQAKDCETGQRGYLLTGVDRYLDPYRSGIDTIHRDIQTVRQLTSDNPNEQRRLDTLDPLIADKFAELKETIDLRRTRGLPAAMKIVLTDRGRKYMDDIRKVVNDMETEELGLLKQRQQDAEVSTHTTQTVMIVVVIVSLILSSTIVAFLTRSISRPVRALLDAVQKVERGDLRVEELPVISSDEVGLLVGAFNNMLSSLRELTRGSQAAAENLNAATTQISASTRQQAASLTEQLSAVQETTTTMDEVAQSGSQIADKARQVGSSAQASSAASVSGLQAMQNTSRSMETIREQVEAVAENVVTLSEKTQAIGDIIATVNDLAERSNLLALNAAIEAASVGEEGSRFSVVASELKNLADQSKVSTVKVRGILGDIQKGIHSSVMLTEEAVKRVEAGRTQADAAEQVIRQTAESTQESVRAFQVITAATNQQQIGFEQVTQALQNIRRASEQNAQGISQLDTAAANMNALSQQLRKAVERFQV